MKKISSLSEKTGDATFRSPEDALEDAIQEVKNGKLKNHKKILILALGETDGDYDVRFMQAGMKMSECISLVEISKTLFLDEMNYLNQQ